MKYMPRPNLAGDRTRAAASPAPIRRHPAELARNALLAILVLDLVATTQFLGNGVGSFPLPAGSAMAQTPPSGGPTLKQPPKVTPEAARARTGDDGVLRGAPDPGFAIAPASLVREGAYLKQRRGRVVRAGNSDNWVYIFDRDAQGNAEPPMVLQPSQRAEEMQRISESRGRPVTFQASGVVYAYAGRNYFLPMFFAELGETASPAAASPAEQGADAPEAPMEAAPSDDPAVNSLLKEMGAGDERRAPTALPGLAAENVPRVTSLMREGITLTARRGRVQRGSGNSLVFVTDNGPDVPGQGTQDPALTLVPCMNLEHIERALQSQGDRMTISVTGQVLSYQQRNYLIPVWFRLEGERDGNIVASP